MHFPSSKSKTSVWGRAILFVMILAIMTAGLLYLLSYAGIYKKGVATIQEVSGRNETGFHFSDDNITFPSITGNNQFVAHSYYALSYSEAAEQAEWVTYEITRDHLNGPKEDRFNHFSDDPFIRTGSADYFDYSGSGYDRGHLASAADMRFDPKAQEECFYMSNISPQVPAFNEGIWRELEENTRDWARKYNNVYVITGPVLKSPSIKQISKNFVVVPSMFYKVILVKKADGYIGVGILLPNEISDLPLVNYMISIDRVELATGIDFFNSGNVQLQIEKAEKAFDLNDWPVNSSRYLERVEVWNKKVGMVK
jgi:endonuclease G